MPSQSSRGTPGLQLRAASLASAAFASSRMAQSGAMAGMSQDGGGPSRADATMRSKSASTPRAFPASVTLRTRPHSSPIEAYSVGHANRVSFEPLSSSRNSASVTGEPLMTENLPSKVRRIPSGTSKTRLTPSRMSPRKPRTGTRHEPPSPTTGSRMGMGRAPSGSGGTASGCARAEATMRSSSVDGFAAQSAGPSTTTRLCSSPVKGSSTTYDWLASSQTLSRMSPSSVRHRPPRRQAPPSGRSTTSECETRWVPVAVVYSS